MKCVEKYDTSAEATSRNFWDMLIDQHSLLRNIYYVNFPWPFLDFHDFQQNSKFPWLILKLVNLSLTLNFPD